MPCLCNNAFPRTNSISTTVQKHGIDRNRGRWLGQVEKKSELKEETKSGFLPKKVWDASHMDGILEVHPFWSSVKVTCYVPSNAQLFNYGHLENMDKTVKMAAGIVWLKLWCLFFFF